ncbi:hypothetical protein OG985_50290 (plasmid) [Streptomyces sp. NBC_00289]|uniref:hypothetical protein n=1 Tax=Streptomyces sp. NBC_00289 TaxID=2975703 RepID=UPI002F90C78B
MTDQKPPGVDVLEAAYARWKDMPPVSLKMHRQDLYLIVMALQTTTRFPGTTPSMAKHMETIGRQIQEAIVDDPELYGMTESGWNPEHDVDPEDGGDQVSAFGEMAGAGHPLGIAMQIPDVTMTLAEAIDRHPLLEDALHDQEVTQTWERAEPETRAALLLSLAWGSREHGIYPGYLPDGADDYGYRTAEEFHQYARDFAGSSEEFHGARFPMMPLPGQAGAFASSLGFDREEDGLDVSLRAALLLLAPARKKPNG